MARQGRAKYISHSGPGSRKPKYGRERPLTELQEKVLTFIRTGTAEPLRTSQLARVQERGVGNMLGTLRSLEAKGLLERGKDGRWRAI